ETPSLRVVTVTEHAAAAAALAGEVAVESVGTAGPRPHGKRFGTLVHAVLAAVELDADHAGVADAAALHGRLLGATAEEVEAAVDGGADAGGVVAGVARRAWDQLHAAYSSRTGRCTGRGAQLPAARAIPWPAAGQPPARLACEFRNHAPWPTRWR